MPMVCFCDLPLSQTTRHIGYFGRYGIGLTKHWGKRKKISPVLYCYQGSSFLSKIENALDVIAQSKTESTRTKFQKRSLVFRIFSYLKPYEGTFKRDGKIYRNIRFYDEREWRFTPPFSTRYPLLMRKRDYFNIPFRQRMEKRIAKTHSISFRASDVKYIIVSQDSEVPTMVGMLSLLKNEFSRNEIKSLSTKIISTERIPEDF